VTDRDFKIKDGNWFPIMHEMADKLMTYRLSGTEWQVMMMFMRFCYGYQNSTCELQWKDMIDFTGLPKGSLSKAINRLKERNILKSFQKETKQQVTYKINSKYSTWKRVSKKKPVSKSEPKGFQKETPTYYKRYKDIPNFFDFYSAYPLKKSKKKAKEIFDRLVKKHILPENNILLSAIENQKQEKIDLKNAGEFCAEWKHPSTWLSQGCWEDEIQTKLIKKHKYYTGEDE
jgi:phage replication O-like protein O